MFLIIIWKVIILYTSTALEDWITKHFLKYEFKTASDIDIDPLA